MPTETSDEAAEAAFIAGAEGALQQAYTAHSPLVFAICRKSLRPEQAEEVTQDVFVNAWRSRQQFDPEKGTLAGWLVGITKRRVIDHLRSEGRHADRRSDAEPDHPTESQIERVADRLLVSELLKELPSRPRRVIELAYMQDLTHQEIVEQTDIPLGTVKSDIRRGLARIRDHLESTHG